MTNIAIYNATQQEVEFVESNYEVEHYWQAMEPSDRVYVMDDCAFIDLEELLDYEHEDLLEAGWEVL